MAVHFTILAQKILWTEEFGSCSIWGRRVRHNGACMQALSVNYVPGPVINTGDIIKQTNNWRRRATKCVGGRDRIQRTEWPSLPRAQWSHRRLYKTVPDTNKSLSHDSPIFSSNVIPSNNCKSCKLYEKENHGGSKSVNKFLVSNCGSASCSKSTAGYESNMTQSLLL